MNLRTTMSFSKRTKYIGVCLSIASLSLCSSSLFAAPTTITVNTATDVNVSTAGVTGSLTDLRGALNTINAASSPNPDGYLVQFRVPQSN